MKAKITSDKKFIQIIEYTEIEIEQLQFSFKKRIDAWRWSQKEEEQLMNYIEADDSKTTADRIKFAHYMMYSKKEGRHPDLKERSLNACIFRYYKVCERIQNEHKVKRIKSV